MTNLKKLPSDSLERRLIRRRSRTIRELGIYDEDSPRWEASPAQLRAADERWQRAVDSYQDLLDQRLDEVRADPMRQEWRVVDIITRADLGAARPRLVYWLGAVVVSCVAWWALYVIVVGLIGGD